jgi:saccharopine dehydrogenase-like NADP-dependent oxidoreductase
MRVLVLGGAGRVGHRIAELLVARGIGVVTRADRVEPSDDLATPFAAVDVGDHGALVRVLEGHDIVVNTVGPYDRWGGRVLDAAIEAATDYVDICDDPWPTLELLERSPRAAERGVRAVVGLGASPGLPNLLMIVAARELDVTDTLISYWGEPSEGLSQDAAAELAARVAASFRAGRAAWSHMLVQTSGTIPAWRDGRRTDVVPWKEPHRITLSGGESGVFRVMGHPEAITVPLLTPTRSCSCMGTVGAGLDRIVLEANTAIADGTLAFEDALHHIADRVEADPSLLMTPAAGAPLPALIGAVATGERDGQRRSVVAMPGGPTDGSMSFETGRVAALGVELIDRVPPGVHAPEAAFDPDEFLTAFSRREWGGAPPYRLDEQDGDAVTAEAVPQGAQ